MRASRRWVVNTVGFYNRKFFMLFLVYANVTLAFCVVFLVSQARERATVHAAHSTLPCADPAGARSGGRRRACGTGSGRQLRRRDGSPGW